MEELKYKKIRCNQGHWSKVYPQGVSLPKNCSVCGQPYNRKIFGPVACLEDGTVPDDNKDDNKDTPMAEPQEKLTSSPEADIIQTRRRVRNQAFDNAGESSEVNDSSVSGNPMGGRRRRRQPDAVSPVSEEAPSVSPAKRGNSRYYLVSSGYRIQIPEEGEHIGRAGMFAQMCALNNLISREHANITINKRRGAVHLIDMNSLNGTYVDDGGGRRRIKEQETVTLMPGTRFWLADQLFFVDVE